MLPNSPTASDVSTKPRGKVIIIHGWNNRPTDGWLGWLAQSLQVAGYEVINPALPLTHAPRPKDWVRVIREQAGDLDERTVIVGYSLGTAVGMRFLNDFGRDVHIAGLVLVSGFGAGFINRPTSLFSPPLDYARLRHRAARRICIYSDNDRVVPPRWSKTLAAQLQAREYVKLGAGHFLAQPRFPNNYSQLPVVLDAVLSCYPQVRRQQARSRLGKVVSAVFRPFTAS